MVPFNGYFGCPWCLIRGEHVEGSMRYVTNEPPEMRTTEILKRDMKLALHYKDIINGVKGPSCIAQFERLGPREWSECGVHALCSSRCCQTADRDHPCLLQTPMSASMLVHLQFWPS
ncbi:hypothetical protein MRX96_049459 [Rhipicephalus microplus]